MVSYSYGKTLLKIENVSLLEYDGDPSCACTYFQILMQSRSWA